MHGDDQGRVVDRHGQPAVGVPVRIPPEEYRRGELFVRFSADSLDSIAFPRSGVLASAEWRGSSRGTLAADEDYDQVLTSVAYARTWGRHTLLSSFRYDATVSGQPPLDRSFRLGGFLDLSGFAQQQLIGERVGGSAVRTSLSGRVLVERQGRRP